MFPCHYIDQIQLLHLITTESKFSTPSSGRSARIECVAVRAGALAAGCSGRFSIRPFSLSLLSTSDPSLFSVPALTLPTVTPHVTPKLLKAAQTTSSSSKRQQLSIQLARAIAATIRALSSGDTNSVATPMLAASNVAPIICFLFTPIARKKKKQRG